MTPVSETDESQEFEPSRANAAGQVVSCDDGRPVFSDLSDEALATASAAVETASTLLGCRVEFVILDEGCAEVIATSGAHDFPVASRRSLDAAEREILAGTPIGLSQTGTAVRVEASDIDVATCALYVAAALDGAGVGLLQGLGPMIKASAAPVNASSARNPKWSSIDQLTGLANRGHLIDRLASLPPRDDGGTIAICFIDIDHFKTINHVHGHRVGDAVLAETALRLSALVGPQDLLARVGGDEFVAVFRGLGNQLEVTQVVDKMRATLAQPFEICGQKLRTTASVGIVAHTWIDGDPEQLLQQAGSALNAAKVRGRDRAETFDEELARASSVHHHQRDMVLDTLDNSRLTMRFEPIVDREGFAIGAEALARCETEDGELIEPGGFLDAIVGTSLLSRLDRQALELTCAAARKLGRDDLWIACNFGAGTLAQSDLSSMVLDTARRAGISPNQLCIEVTESAAFDAGPQSVEELKVLHDAGVRLALDDFGTGYSSLAHLRDLPLSTVKIDRSFTDAFDQPGPEQAIVTAVRDLANSLDFRVVAEGIEHPQQWQAARHLGLHAMQGWHISKPATFEQLDQMLQGGALVSNKSGAGSRS